MVKNLDLLIQTHSLDPMSKIHPHSHSYDHFFALISYSYSFYIKISSNLKSMHSLIHKNQNYLNLNHLSIQVQMEVPSSSNSTNQSHQKMDDSLSHQYLIFYYYHLSTLKSTFQQPLIPISHQEIINILPNLQPYDKPILMSHLKMEDNQKDIQT